jgi:hypothetical protein
MPSDALDRAQGSAIAGATDALNQAGGGAMPRKGLAAWIPALNVLREYRLGWLRNDIVAGIVLSTMLVPVGIAYAVASDVPAIYGLYATIVPMIAYAIFGPSRILVLGPDSSLAPLYPRRGPALVRGRFRPGSRNRERHGGRRGAHALGEDLVPSIVVIDCSPPDLPARASLVGNEAWADGARRASDNLMNTRKSG